MYTLIGLLLVGATLYGGFLALRAVAGLLMEREWSFAGFLVASVIGAVVLGLTLGYIYTSLF